MKKLLLIFIVVFILGCKKADEITPELYKYTFNRDTQNQSDSIQKVFIGVSQFKSDDKIEFTVLDKNGKLSTHSGKYRYRTAGKLDYYELPISDNWFIIQRKEPKDSILWAIINKEVLRFYKSN